MTSFLLPDTTAQAISAAAKLCAKSIRKCVTFAVIITYMHVCTSAPARIGYITCYQHCTYTCKTKQMNRFFPEMMHNGRSLACTHTHKDK